MLSHKNAGKPSKAVRASRSPEKLAPRNPVTNYLHALKLNVKLNWELYLFVIPLVAYYLVFKYAPIYGIQIAFKDYNLVKGVSGSPWVGLKHFKAFFNTPFAWNTIWNTFSLSIAVIICEFPLPILLALMLNYARSIRLKNGVQLATYAPHFISTVVLAGMVLTFLSKNGVVNSLLGLFNVDPVLFMNDPAMFKPVYVVSSVWQHTGWNAIIYISALAAVDPCLYEAARVDGANKWQIVWKIDIPSITPTIVVLLLLNLGNVMSVGFEKAFLLQNDLNLVSSEIISTYLYKVGMVDLRYSFSAAVDVFNSAINLVMLLTFNKLSKKLLGRGLW